MRESYLKLLVIATIGWFALATAVQASASPGEPVGVWPQWRGPGGLGISDQASLPEVWGGPENTGIRWSTPIPGEGNSSPIVSGNHVFLTSAVPVEKVTVEFKKGYSHRSGTLDRKLFAFDLDSGTLLWERTVYRGPAELTNFWNTLAAPTPVTDGKRVYVYIGSHLAAYDFDGNEVWNLFVNSDLEEESLYGTSGSPILVDGDIIVHADRERGYSEIPGWMARYDAETGKQVWRTETMKGCCSYATPTVYKLGDKTEILHLRQKRINALDPDSGEVLWDAEFEYHQPVSGIVYADDLLCLATGAHHVQIAGCVRIAAAEDGIPRLETLWTTTKAVPAVASPLLYRGRFYMVTETGILTVVHPESGLVIKQRRLPVGRYHASLLGGDDKIFASTVTGKTTVVAANDELQIIAENQIEGTKEHCGASPAVAPGCFLVRTASELHCIGTGKAEDDGEGLKASGISR